MDKWKAVQEVDRQADMFCRISDEIWEHPELRFEEYVSAQILKTALEELGFELSDHLAGLETAFCGRYGSGHPVIGILGEFDALSNLSQKADCAEPSPLVPSGNGHGCGHNNLGAGSLAAAAAIKKYLEESRNPGTVIYFGCPGEEGGGGKTIMARQGIFEELDCALTWHPNDINNVWSGSSLANVQVHYYFKGIAAHAAACPHLGRSALDGLTLMNTGVQFLREHIIPEARIHYSVLNTGSVSPNVVQAETEALYLIRAPKSEQVKELYKRVCDIAEGAALMTGTKVSHYIEKGYAEIIPNHTLARCLYDNMEQIPLPTYTEEEKAYARAMRAVNPRYVKLSERLKGVLGEKGGALGLPHDGEDISEFLFPYTPSERALSGSSDVGDVSYICPVSQIVAATVALDTAAHSWQQVAQGKSSIAHKGMLYAGKVLAAAAIDLLENPELLRKAKTEQKNRLGDRSYLPLKELCEQANKKNGKQAVKQDREPVAVSGSAAS